MPVPKTPGPLTATRFELTVDGHSIASFTELVGISSAIDVASLSAGTDEPIQHLPGRALAPAVVLERHMSKNIELAAWHELVVLGDLAAGRKTCSLTMFNAAAEPVARYHLSEAWPRTLEVRTDEASGILIETVTLICDFLQRVSV
jgi:phage tail-like protein